MIVMVTGASRGIGFETVRYFARLRDCQIIALSRNAGGLHQLTSFNKISVIHTINFDLNLLPDNPGTILNLIPKEIAHIDILINNAGTLINKPFQEFTGKEAEQMFRINSIAPALLTKELLPLMGGSTTTHVVNISSMGGFQGSQKFPGLSYYSASKAALACLTECLQEELKEYGIVFNCLALGAVQTEMFSEAFPGHKAPLSPSEIADFIGNFALNAHKYMQGKIVPVSRTNP
jgi:3-oxoacyl-[acyl-carrier protein] reductase